MPLKDQLAHVMFEDCFVLGWATEQDRLSIEIEASLWPGHSHYSPPQQGEWACYKPASLVFSGVQNLQGLISMHEAKVIPGPDVPPDFGTLEAISESGGTFKISGPFGQVSFLAQSAKLIFK